MGSAVSARSVRVDGLHPFRRQGSAVPAPIGEELRDRLALLYRVLRPAPDETLEACVDTRGDAAALVYRRCRLIPPELRSVLRGLPVASGSPSVLWAILEGVPAWRHALKVATSGAVSLFCCIDLPASSIASLYRALGLEEDADAIGSYFLRVGHDAHGLAVETAPDQRLPRVRTYDMVRTGHQLARLCEAARVAIGLTPDQVDDLVETWRRLGNGGKEAIVNVGAGGGRRSIKLEFPCPRRSAVDQLVAPSHPVWRLAGPYLVGSDDPAYVGVRWTIGADGPVTTLYLDAHPVRHRMDQIVGQP